MQRSSTMTKEETPKTPRSIVRNHSPYSESTGPIVEEGFVAARVRALQGFSDQSQSVTRSRYPPTPCPLHVNKLHSPPRPSLALKPLSIGLNVSGTYNLKHFHTQALSKNRGNLVDVPGVTARSSDVALSFRPLEQQCSLGPTTPHRLSMGPRGAGNPFSTHFKNIVLSSTAERGQDDITASNKTDGPLSKLDHVDADARAVNSSTSEKSILSPHAIKPDLVEPGGTWNCLSQTEDRNNDYIHEQALKPRGSIVEKLDSMVDRGWVGGDIFSTIHDDGELAFHTTESKIKISDSRLDSPTNSSEELARLKQVASYSGSLSPSTSNAEKPSQSQHSERQSTLPNVKQKEPRAFVYQGLQKRRKREAKRSHAGNSPQRSSSEAGLRYLKAVPAIRGEKRRAWTLPSLGHSKSNYGYIQASDAPTSWPSYARDPYSDKQSHGSIEMPPSREGSTPKSGFDLSMLKGEQLGQDPAVLSKMNVSRRSSAITKSSTRSGSRSISFFKKFPWYKVALVDKPPVAHSLSKRSSSDDRTPTANRNAYPYLNSNHVELSRSVTKLYTPIEFEVQGDRNDPKTKTAPHQGPIDKEAMDDKSSYYKASSQPFIQLMLSPQEMNAGKAPEQDRRVQEYSHDAHATSLKVGGKRLLRNPDQHMTGPEHGPTRAGQLREQPGACSQSGSINVSSEPQVADDALQSFRIQGPQVVEQSRVQSHTSSHAYLTNRHANKSLEKDSLGSGTAESEHEFSARPSLSHGPRSDVVGLTPKCPGGGRCPSPANVERSDHHGPMPRGIHGGGKGIKKIQVTVTFDGAEDLVVEATLRKKG